MKNSNQAQSFYPAPDYFQIIMVISVVPRVVYSQIYRTAFQHPFEDCISGTGIGLLSQISRNHASHPAAL